MRIYLHCCAYSTIYKNLLHYALWRLRVFMEANKYKLNKKWINLNLCRFNFLFFIKKASVPPWYDITSHLSHPDLKLIMCSCLAIKKFFGAILSKLKMYFSSIWTIFLSTRTLSFQETPRILSKSLLMTGYSIMFSL